MRSVALLTALAFVGLLAGLTIVVAIQYGVDVFTFIAVGVLALILFGIVGALMNPPPGER